MHEPPSFQQRLDRAQEEWTQYWTTDIECKPTPGPPGPRITLKQLNYTLRTMSDNKARGLNGWRPSELYAPPNQAKQQLIDYYHHAETTGA